MHFGSSLSARHGRKRSKLRRPNIKEEDPMPASKYKKKKEMEKKK